MRVRVRVQLWGATGALHGRCRSTPHPVLLPPLWAFGDALPGAPLEGFARDGHSHSHGNGSTAVRVRSYTRCLLADNDSEEAWGASPSGEGFHCAWPLAMTETGSAAFQGALAGYSNGAGARRR